MTLLLMDSARQPGNAASQWTVFSPASGSPTPILGLEHYDLDNDRTTPLVVDFVNDEDDVVIIGMRVHMNAFDVHEQGTGSDYFLRLEEATGSIRHLWLRFIGGDGRIRVQRGSTILHTTDVAQYPFGAWFFIEFKVRIHETLGTIQVRVDGVDVINETGLDTQEGAGDGLIDRISFGSAESNSIKLRITDIHVMNEQGGAPLNDLIGPHTIESLRADGAGNYTNWDPLAGTNWESVDDPIGAAADGDTTYVETTVAERDSYTFEPLFSDNDPIAVQVKANSRFTGAQQDFNTFLRRSGTDDDGDTETANASEFRDRAITIYETDPIAAAAWTKTNFEATEFGIRTTA